MKLFIFSLLLSLPALAGTCCVGSGPRSFVQLKHLQTYDLGLATSFRDVYARFNPYGTRVANEKDQSLTTALGASFRIAPRAEVFGVLPFVTKTKALGGEAHTRSDLGDVGLGTKVLLYDPLFADEVFPETRLVASVKAPSGRADSVNTGNGIWEGSLGLQFSKDFGPLLVHFIPSYTRRFSRTVFSPTSESVVKEGDRLELSETVVVPVSERLSFQLGSTQVFDFDGTLDGRALADSGGRYTTGLVGGSYYLTRLWTVSAAFESVLPIEKLNVNQEGFRTVTVTTTYAIY